MQLRADRTHFGNEGIDGVIVAVALQGQDTVAEVTDGLFEFGDLEIIYIFPSPRTLLRDHPKLWPVLWAEYNRGAHLRPPSPESAFDGLWSELR